MGPESGGGRLGGPRYDAALRLLDRQLVDPDGRLVGKVDDLELTPDAGGGLLLTAVLTGPGALGYRLGGRVGGWMVRIWQRLHPEPGPEPNRVDIADVVEIGSAVHLARRAEALGLEGFDRWLHDRVTGHIPGAGQARTGPAPDRPDPVAGPPAAGRHRLSDLLGCRVQDAGGNRRGFVNDVRLGPAPGVDGLTARLRVEGIVVADRSVGSLLGYDRRAAQGPWLVRAAVRRLHRGAGHTSWDGVRRIDWSQRLVVVDQLEPLDQLRET